MFCPNCGAEVGDGHSFCGSCGKPLQVANSANPKNVRVEVTANGSKVDPGNVQVSDASGDGTQDTHYNVHVNYTVPTATGPGIYIPKRSIAVAVILSIITCGIYSLYWICRINDETNAISGNMHATTGGIVLLLTIVTCGIYGWYWHFIMGTRLDQACANHGRPFGDRGLIYLLLAIFTFGIISMCLEQHTLNTLVDDLAA